MKKFFGVIAGLLVLGLLLTSNGIAPPSPMSPTAATAATVVAE